MLTICVGDVIEELADSQFGLAGNSARAGDSCDCRFPGPLPFEEILLTAPYVSVGRSSAEVGANGPARLTLIEARGLGILTRVVI